MQSIDVSTCIRSVILPRSSTAIRSPIDLDRYRGNCESGWRRRPHAVDVRRHAVKREQQTGYHRPRLLRCRHDAFGSLAQARSDLESWRIDYNGVRPHSALANWTPHIAVAALTSNCQNFNPGLYA